MMILENSLTSQSARKAHTTAPAGPLPLAGDSWWAPLLRVLLALVLNVAMLAAIALPIKTYIAPPGPHTPWFAWLIALTWQPLMALQGLLFFRWVDRRPLSQFPLRLDGRARQAALWGALLSAAMLLAFIALTSWTGVTIWRLNPGFQPAATLLTTLMLASAGLGEEFFFRGYVIGTFGYYGPRAAVILSAVVFALMHMVVGRVAPIDQLALFIHGIFFAILAQRSGSVLPGMIIHAVYNGLTSLVWSGDAATAILLFDGQIVTLKWAFKAAMVLPYLLMVWAIYRPKRLFSGPQA